MLAWNLSCNKANQKPEFYVDSIKIQKKIYACDDFSTQFRKIFLRYIKLGYNI